MQSWADSVLNQLRPKYPDWDIWYVPCVVGPAIWAARPKGAAIAMFNAYSPEVLIELIRDAS